MQGIILCQYVPCTDPVSCASHGVPRFYYAQVRVIRISKPINRLRLISLLDRPRVHEPLLHNVDVVAAQVAGVAIAIGFVLVFSSFVIPWCVA